MCVLYGWTDGSVAHTETARILSNVLDQLQGKRFHKQFTLGSCCGAWQVPAPMAMRFNGTAQTCIDRAEQGFMSLSVQLEARGDRGRRRPQRKGEVATAWSMCAKSATAVVQLLALPSTRIYERDVADPYPVQALS